MIKYKLNINTGGGEALTSLLSLQFFAYKVVSNPYKLNAEAGKEYRAKADISEIYYIPLPTYNYPASVTYDGKDHRFTPKIMDANGEEFSLNEYDQESNNITGSSKDGKLKCSISYNKTDFINCTGEIEISLNFYTELDNCYIDYDGTGTGTLKEYSTKLSYQIFPQELTIRVPNRSVVAPYTGTESTISFDVEPFVPIRMNGGFIRDPGFNYTTYPSYQTKSFELIEDSYRGFNPNNYSLDYNLGSLTITPPAVSPPGGDVEDPVTPVTPILTTFKVYNANTYFPIVIKNMTTNTIIDSSLWLPVFDDIKKEYSYVTDSFYIDTSKYSKDNTYSIYIEIPILPNDNKVCPWEVYINGIKMSCITTDKHIFAIPFNIDKENEVTINYLK